MRQKQDMSETWGRYLRRNLERDNSDFENWTLCDLGDESWLILRFSGSKMSAPYLKPLPNILLHCCTAHQPSSWITIWSLGILNKLFHWQSNYFKRYNLLSEFYEWLNYFIQKGSSNQIIYNANFWVTLSKNSQIQ